MNASPRVAIIGDAPELIDALRSVGALPTSSASADRSSILALCRGADVLVDARPVGDDLPLEVALAAGLPAAALTDEPSRLSRLRDRFHASAVTQGTSLAVGLAARTAAPELLAVALAETSRFAELEAAESIEIRWVFERAADALHALSGAGWTWESGQRTRRRAGGPPDEEDDRAALWIPSGVAVTLPWRIAARRVDVRLSTPAAVGRPLSLLAGLMSGSAAGSRLRERLSPRGGGRLTVAVSGRTTRRVRRTASVALASPDALTASIAAAAVTALAEGTLEAGVLGPGSFSGDRLWPALDRAVLAEVEL